MFLIDSHILLWAVINPDKLTSKEKEVLTKIENKIYVSAASIWEIAIKVALKKLLVPEHFEQEVKNLGFDIIPVNFNLAWKIKDFPSHHKDPFDHLIAATALEHQLTLITHDPIFKQYGVKVLK